MAVDFQMACSNTGNFIINSLSPTEHKSLLPYIKPIYVRFNDTIYNSGDHIKYVYFPVEAVISSLAVMEDGATVEVDMVGKEGVIGLSSILGSGTARHWSRALVAGRVLRMESLTLLNLFARSQSLQTALLGSYQSLITQISQRAVCNARHTVLERLCCWLLMTHDRVGTAYLPLTQEVIAGRLGTRRAGISTAAGMLQSSEAIRYCRGKIHITNRSFIESMACECYEAYKMEFDRFCKAPEERASRRGLERERLAPPFQRRPPSTSPGGFPIASHVDSRR